MSLASIKRSIKVGTMLKLVRHDWLKPMEVNVKFYIGIVRPVTVVRGNAIAMKGEVNDSWLYWPKADSVRDTPSGFEVDLNHDGKFTAVMGYEFV